MDIQRSIKFHSDQISLYCEANIQTIAFAEGESPDPSKYLILQRDNTSEEDSYYYEIFSRENSGEGGLISTEVHPSLITFSLSKPLQERYGFSSIEISLPINYGERPDFIAALESMFTKSDCTLKFF